MKSSSRRNVYMQHDKFSSINIDKKMNYDDIFGSTYRELIKLWISFTREQHIIENAPYELYREPALIGVDNQLLAIDQGGQYHVYLDCCQRDDLRNSPDYTYETIGEPPHSHALFYAIKRKDVFSKTVIFSSKKEISHSEFSKIDLFGDMKVLYFNDLLGELITSTSSKLTCGMTLLGPLMEMIYLLKKYNYLSPSPVASLLESLPRKVESFPDLGEL